MTTTDIPTPPLVYAGPCSAESEDQLHRVAADLAAIGVRHLRAGIWKPRSKPGGFEGVGEPGLRWLRDVGDRYGLQVGTEVGTTEHARLALDYGMDFVWIGARTTTSPFTVSEIADVLAGQELTVLVKNPIAPDIDLWAGALRRLIDKGLTHIAAIHRGFSVGGEALLRNLPLWTHAHKLRSLLPDIPLLCDPSHISGDSDLVPIIIHEARLRGYDGLFVEVHPHPATALSDAAQQITPDRLRELLDSTAPNPDSNAVDEVLSNRLTELDRLRIIIDGIDEEIIRLLSERMQVSGEIGRWKDEHRLPHHQPEREQHLYRSRTELARLYGVSPQLVEALYHTIHDYSKKHQDDDAPHR